MKASGKFRTVSRGLLSLLAGCLIGACVSSAQAAQRVYLRTGSSLVCDHQKNLGNQVRLYFTASDENYLDVAVNDIVRVETVPDEALRVETRPAVAHQIDMVSATKSVDIPALLDRAGAEHHIDPDLLASVIRAESGGHAHAISHVGARGLMQLMPGTASELGVRNSFAPEQNVAGGTTYLDALLMYYHENLALALAAYNAGPAAVNRYGGIPPYAETRRYVERVIHDYNLRKIREARRHTEVAQVSSATGAAAGR